MRMVTMIPALDEAAAIGRVVRAISRALVHAVMVVDHGSRDGTAAVAQAAGAPVMQELQRGYGAACSPAAHGGARAGQAPLLAGEFIYFNHRGGPSMTKLGRSTTIRFLVFAMLVLAATSWAQTRPPIAEQIAKTYGLDSFGQIEAIRYTFNLDLGALKLSRAWVWEPQADRISYDGKDQAGQPVKTTYVRSQLSSQPAVVKDEVDPAFVNDQYWLVLPFHVVWDGANVEDTGMHKLPLGKGSARRVVVKYASEGGYSPGDTWELYVGSDNRVEELVYRRGGPQKPSVVVATWAGYKQAGPLLISSDHRGTADGKPMRVFFSNVSVKLMGSDTWVNAK
jgi:glycosyltransferase involved in cell wall biosynthesis